MVDRSISQFRQKQTQGTCILFSYCLIMSHFLNKPAHELITEFVHEYSSSNYIPNNLKCAEIFFVQECYCILGMQNQINNLFIESYHNRKYSSSRIIIELKSLNKSNDILYLKQILTSKEALISASYQFMNQNNWHCTPIGYDSEGFYLIQTNQGYNNIEIIQDLNNLRSISYVVEPGDCLLIYK